MRKKLLKSKATDWTQLPDSGPQPCVALFATYRASIHIRQTAANPTWPDAPSEGGHNEQSET